MFLDIVGRRAIPANLAQLWSERDSFLWAFWGFFGGVNVPLATWVYTIFNMLAGIAIIGGVIYCISAITRALQQRTNRRGAESAMEHSLASSASLRFSFSFSIAHLVSLLWILVTFVSYLRWTAETPASQGRLMFGALSAISVWVAVGWAWWLPQRLAFVFVLPLLLVSATTPTGVIQPVYSSPPISIISPQAEAAIFIASDDGDIAVVENGGVTRQSITPENYVLIVPTFAVVERLARDWSLFVHLVTPDGVIIGQRDVYPARGLLATSDLEVGHTWYNPIAVWIPANAYAPQTLEIVLGWYHLPSGERMRLEDGSETLTLGQVELRLRESDLNVPNPITINFGNQIELVGYSLSDLSPAAGDDVMLTLYWRALRPLMTDYTVFAQILDSATTTIYGASDAQPAAWTRPTSSWVVGEIIEDIHTLTINPDTPTSPGIYDIYVGLYTRGDDGSFNRLRVISPDGGQAFDYTELSRVRVLPQGDL
jgi:hypothetical protein